MGPQGLAGVQGAMSLIPASLYQLAYFYMKKKKSRWFRDLIVFGLVYLICWFIVYSVTHNYFIATDPEAEEAVYLVCMFLSVIIIGAYEAGKKTKLNHDEIDESSNN